MATPSFATVIDSEGAPLAGHRAASGVDAPRRKSVTNVEDLKGVPVATATSVAVGDLKSGGGFERRRSSTKRVDGELVFVMGPTNERRCTDFPCFLFFIAYVVLWTWFSLHVINVSNVGDFMYARDHTGKRCKPERIVNGNGNFSKVYYPDIGYDYVQDPTLRSLYGVCVDECPKKGEIIEDYSHEDEDTGENVPPRQARWFVSQPSLDILNRCIPYEQDDLLNSSGMCAWPECTGTTEDDPNSVINITQVCGLESENTNTYWLVGEPESFYIDGWLAEGVPQAVVDKRKDLWTQPDAQSACKIKVERGVTIRIVDENKNGLQVVLERYLGTAVRFGMGILENLNMVLLIGLGFSVIAAMFVISSFAFCVRCIIISLIALMFAALIILNYILYVKADFTDVGTAYLGEKALGIGFGSGGAEDNEETIRAIRDTVLSEASDPRVLRVYQIAAIVTSILTAGLFCVVMNLKKHLDLLVQLTAEAAKVIRQMPTLLGFPLLGLSFVACMIVYFGVVGVAILMLPVDEIEDILMGVTNVSEISDFMNSTNTSMPETSTVRQAMIWGTIFSFLYFYYFQVAVFVCGIAGAVSQWYFYRNDEKDAASSALLKLLGLPAVESLWYVMRYHLGTLSFGAFVIALAAMPRIILEYIDQQTKEAQESNPLLKCGMCVARCFLWCFHKCIKYLTSMTFINTAVTGETFCKSARTVFGIIWKDPIQLGLIKIATWALTMLMLLTVPLASMILSYFAIQASWLPCVMAIAGISVLVSYMTIDVYDVVINTLFIAFRRDMDQFAGVYAPQGFRDAMGVPDPTEEEVEMVTKKMSPDGSGGGAVLPQPSMTKTMSSL